MAVADWPLRRRFPARHGDLVYEGWISAPVDSVQRRRQFLARDVGRVGGRRSVLFLFFPPLVRRAGSCTYGRQGGATGRQAAGGAAAGGGRRRAPGSGRQAGSCDVGRRWESCAWVVVRDGRLRGEHEWDARFFVEPGGHGRRIGVDVAIAFIYSCPCMATAFTIHTVFVYFLLIHSKNYKSFWLIQAVYI